MPIVKRFTRPLLPVLAGLITALALVPAASAQTIASTSSTAHGSTALVLSSTATGALSELGITPGLVAPAYAANGALQFPITNRFLFALLTTTIKHSGGISLTKGDTTVDLTDFDIDLASKTLTAEVNGAGPVPILALSFAGAKIGYPGGGEVTVGPVTATLTATAASALNSAFDTTAFTAGLDFGQATVQYWLG